MGSHYGIAFQIIDDLLDYGVGAQNMDKALFTDIENGLVTLPLIFYFEKCSAEEHKAMENALPRFDADGEKIYGLLGSGALALNARRRRRRNIWIPRWLFRRNTAVPHYMETLSTFSPR